MAKLSDFLKILFWINALGLFYTFLGYPMLMWCLIRLRTRKAMPAGWGAPPPVTVLLVVHNEQRRIAARIDNLLESDYPTAKLQVLVVSDGSDDDTVAQTKRHSDPPVHLLECAPRVGKAACLNRGAREVTGDFIVFADARQRFAPETISRLVAWFGDPRIGAVSGSLSIEPSGSNAGKGVDAYWQLERSLREWEARFDSCIGCTGAVYAVRRQLFDAIPADTLLDDVVIPMQIAAKGYRVIFDPDAHAYDPQALEPETERIRKRRTLAGNFQMLFRYPGWLLPWRSRLWWQLLSHKYLRLVSPVFLLLMLITSALLVNQPLYGIILAGQATLWLLGLAGLLRRGDKHACLSIPAGFLFLNWMVVEACWHFAFAPKQGIWKPVKFPKKNYAPTV